MTDADFEAQQQRIRQLEQIKQFPPLLVTMDSAFELSLEPGAQNFARANDKVQPLCDINPINAELCVLYWVVSDL